MKVLLVNVLYKYGSTGRICKSIEEFLHNNGSICKTACRYSDIKDNNIYEVSTWLDCHIHNRLVKYTGLQGYFSIIRTMRFIRYIKKENYDIVHLHNIFNSYLNFKILISFLAKNNIKVIYTLHDCQAYTGGCPHYTIAQCYKWKSECNHCIQRKTIIDLSKKVYKDKKQYLNMFKQENFYITTVSKWLNNECKQSFLRKYNIVTIPNGIDTNTFYKENLTTNKNNKFIILGVASNWNEKKGLNKFIELSKRLDKNELIVLIGLSDKQIKKLPNNIIGIARTKDVNELRYYYNLADVFVNLSREETFGLVVGEALSCGTPAIVYNSTACGEMVNEDCGIVLTKYDTKSLYEAIKIIKNNGKKYYSDNAIKHIKDNYNIIKMQEKYYELYNKIIKE